MPPCATEPSTHAHPLSAADDLGAAMGVKDPSTRRHCEVVSKLCDRMAVELKLDRRRRERLMLAAGLHDVGKLWVPDSILQKAGRLDEREFQTIRRHPSFGARILRAAGLDGIAPFVQHHHERVDGRGYPSGLRGEQIPLESRIILVADAFEAMTAERPYARAQRPAEAIRELERHAGTQFDGRCVAAIVTALDGIRPGTIGTMRAFLPAPHAGPIDRGDTRSR